MESPLQPATPGSSRKRPRENETESQRQKREKAAERQRRKRERDRNNNSQQQTLAATQASPSAAAAAVANMTGLMGFSPNDPHHHHHPHLLSPSHTAPPHPTPSVSTPVQVIAPTPVTGDYQHNPEGLTPDELARRDRVRAAARERQRKHRALVKQRKLRDMGIDPSGNELLTGSAVDNPHYRFGPAPDGAYPQVLPHDLQAPGGPHMHDPQQFAQPAPGLGGQTFASTLLLSFSCAPLLKQHLLRTLHMSNEELASLEPVLAEAWERWDHARRAHYAEQAAKAGLAPPPLGYPAPVVPVDPSLTPEQQQAHLAAAFQQMHSSGSSTTPPNAAGTSTGSTTADSPQPNEFRERFQRSIGGPTPFRSFNGGGTGGGNGNGNGESGSVSTPTSASTSTSGDAIDPQLAVTSVNGSAVDAPVNSSNNAPAPTTTSPPSASTAKKSRKRG